MDTKRDIYNNKQTWESWKKRKKISGVGSENTKIIVEFLEDMEQGINVSTRTRKGPRSETTLINLRDHVGFFFRHIKKPYTKLTQKDLHNLDRKIQEGKIKKRDGSNFKAFGNYIKDFKSFWGWLIRTKRVEEDITRDLSRSVKQKPSWVYLTEQQFKDMANHSNPEYKPLMWFMYDTGMRVTEAYSIKVKHFLEDFTKLRIPDEASKTFGRTINLKICTTLIKDYVKFNNLQPEDFLIQKKSPAFNKYLRTICKKLYGEGETQARGHYHEFSIYDIRHNSACYWLKRYPNMRGLMYRFGWKREEQATYYHEFLGLSDEISDENMLTEEDKNKVEKLEDEIETLKKINEEERKNNKTELDKIYNEQEKTLKILKKMGIVKDYPSKK